jgi:hypothetical protein
MLISVAVDTLGSDELLCNTGSHWQHVQARRFVCVDASTTVHTARVGFKQNPKLPNTCFLGIETKLACGEGIMTQLLASCQVPDKLP